MGIGFTKYSRYCDAIETKDKLTQQMGLNKIHTYAASFGEDLAKKLIETHTNEGDTVLDPFMGAGTSIFQSYIMKRNAIGIDIDPVACMIVRIISIKYDDNEINNLDKLVKQKLDSLEHNLSLLQIDNTSFSSGSTFNIGGISCIVPDNTKIDYWFAPIQRAILAALVNITLSIEDSKLADIVRVAISSSIIHKWPNTLSLARDVDHSRPHKTDRTDLTVKQQIDIFRKVWNRVIKIILQHNVAIGDSNSSIKVLEGDVCDKLDDLEKESIEYVLTSPPYFNAIDYPRAHRYSCWWLWPDRLTPSRPQYVGLKSRGNENKKQYEETCKNLIQNRIGNFLWLKKLDDLKYESLCRYIVDLNDVIVRLKTVLKDGKNITFILANNRINDVEIPLSDIVGDLFIKNHLNSFDIEKRPIQADRRRYPYGIEGFKGLLEYEFIISAKK